MNVSSASDGRFYSESRRRRKAAAFRDFRIAARRRHLDTFVISCQASSSPGRASPEVPNMYGRPWAKIWEEHHEKDMRRPPEKELISFR
jgi:hypothetical protein